MKYSYSHQFFSKHAPKSFQEFWIGPYKITKIRSLLCYKIQSVAKPEDKDVAYAQNDQVTVQLNKTRAETLYSQTPKLRSAVQIDVISQ